MFKKAFCEPKELGFRRKTLQKCYCWCTCRLKLKQDVSRVIQERPLNTSMCLKVHKYDYVSKVENILKGSLQ